MDDKVQKKQVGSFLLLFRTKHSILIYIEILSKRMNLKPFFL